jgi:hypothetical protein
MTVDLPPPLPDTRRVAQPGPLTSSTTSGDIRPGDLTFAWRFTLMFGWIAAFFAYAAVWQASVQLGIATWWVGPRSQPTPTMIRMIPFIMTIVAGLLTVYNVRRVSFLSLGTAFGSLLIAVPDLSRSVGLAAVEIMISIALIVVSAASLTGRYRLVPADSGDAETHRTTTSIAGAGFDGVATPASTSPSIPHDAI